MSDDTPIRMSEVTSSLEESKSLTPSILRAGPSDIMIDTSSPSSSFNTSGLVTPQKVIQRAQTTPEALKELLHETEFITTEDDLRKVNAQLKNHILTQGDIVSQKEEEIFKIKSEYSSLKEENKRLEDEIEKLKRLINDTERNLDEKTTELDFFTFEKKTLEKRIRELERENFKLKELVKGESVEFFKSELQEKIKVIEKIKELESLVSDLNTDKSSVKTSLILKQKILHPAPKENSEIVIKMDELVKKLIEQKERLVEEKEIMEMKLESLLADKNQGETELYQRLEKLINELNTYKSRADDKGFADSSVMTEKSAPDSSLQVKLPSKASSEFIVDMETIIESLKQETLDLKEEKEKIQQKLEKLVKKHSQDKLAEQSSEEQVKELNSLIQILQNQHDDLAFKLEKLENDEKIVNEMTGNFSPLPVIFEKILQDRDKLKDLLAQSADLEISNRLKCQELEEKLKVLQEKLENFEEKESKHKAEVLEKVEKIDEIINEINEGPSLFDVTEDQEGSEVSKDESEIKIKVEQEKQDLPKEDQKEGFFKNSKSTKFESSSFEQSERKKKTFKEKNKEYSEDSEKLEEIEEITTITVSQTKKITKRETFETKPKSASPEKSSENVRLDSIPTILTKEKELKLKENQTETSSLFPSSNKEKKNKSSDIEDDDEFHDAISDPSIIEGNLLDTSETSAPIQTLKSNSNQTKDEKFDETHESLLTLIPSNPPKIPGLSIIPSSEPGKTSPVPQKFPENSRIPSFFQQPSKDLQSQELINRPPGLSQKTTNIPGYGSKDSNKERPLEPSLLEPTKKITDKSNLKITSKPPKVPGNSEDVENFEAYPSPNISPIAKNESRATISEKNEKGEDRIRQYRPKSSQEDLENIQENPKAFEVNLSSPIYLRKDRTSSIDKETYKKLPGTYPSTHPSGFLKIEEEKDTDFEQVSQTKVEINEKLDDLVEKLEEVKRKTKENDEIKQKLRDSLSENQRLKEIIESAFKEQDLLNHELKNLQNEKEKLSESKTIIEDLLNNLREDHENLLKLKQEEPYQEVVLEEMQVSRANPHGETLRTGNERRSTLGIGSGQISFSLTKEKPQEEADPDDDSSDSESKGSVSIGSWHSGKVENSESSKSSEKQEFSTSQPFDSKFNQEVKRVNDIKLEMYQKLEEKQKELDALKGNLEIFKSQNNELTENNKKLNHVKQEKEELEGHLHALQEDLREKELASEGLAVKVKELEKEINILTGDRNNDIKALAEELQKSRNERTAIEEKLNKEVIEKENALELMIAAASEKKKIDDLLHLAEQEKNKLADEKNLLNKKLDLASQDLQKNEEKCEQIKDLLEKKQLELQEIRENLQKSLQNEKKNYENLKEELEKKLEDQIVEKEILKENLKNEFEKKLEDEREKSENEKIEIVKDFEKIIEEKDQLLGSLHSLGLENQRISDQLSLLNDHIKELQVENDLLKGKVLGSEQENEELGRKLQEFLSKNESLEDKLKKNHEVIENLENNNKITEIELKNTLNDLENRSKSHESQVKELDAQIKSFENQINILKSDLNEKEENTKKLNSQLFESQSKNSKILQDLEKLQETFSINENILLTQKGTIEKLESNIKETKKALENSLKENQDLSESLTKELKTLDDLLEEKEKILSQLSDKLVFFESSEKELKEKTEEFEKAFEDLYKNNGGKNFPHLEEVEKIMNFNQRVSTSQDFYLFELGQKYDQIKDLLSEIENLKQLENDLKDEISELIPEKAAKEHLEEILKNNQQENKNLKENNENLQEKCLKLEENLEVLQKNLKDKSESLESLHSQIDSANQELEKQSENNSSLENLCSLKDLKISDLEEIIKDKNSVIQSQLNDLKNSEEKCESLLKSLECLESELSEKSKNLSTLEETLNTLEEKLKNLQEKHEFLQENLKMSKFQLVEQEDLRDQLLQENEFLKETISALQEKEKFLEETLNMSRLEIDQQEDEKDDLLKKNASLKEKENLLEHELQKLSAEIAAKKTDLAMKDLKIQELEEKEKELEKIQEEHNISVLEIHNQNIKIREWEQELFDIRQKEELERANNEKSRLLINEYEEKIESQKNQFEELSKNVLGEKEKIALHISNLEKIREDLRQQLKTKEIELVEGNKEKEILLTQINELNVKLAFNDQPEIEKQFVLLKNEIQLKEETIKELMMQNSIIIARSRGSQKQNTSALEVEIKRLRNEVEILSFQGLTKNDVISAMTQEMEEKNLKQMKTSQDLAQLYKLLKNYNECKMKYLRNYSENLKYGHDELMQVVSEAENKLIHASHNDMNFILSMTILCLLFSLVLALSKKLIS